MTISNALANALSGLGAAGRMTEVVSSNIANALTDGYARRELQLAAQSVGGRGAGVKVLGVERKLDPGILAERRLADAELSFRSEVAAGLKRLEEMIGEAGSAGSLSDRVARLEEALTDAAADPASDSHLSMVLRRLTELSSAVNEAAADVQVMRYEADQDIAGQVQDLNTALRRVEELNGDITRARAIGHDATALMDQRQVVIDRIAEMVPVRIIPRDGDRVAVMTPAGQMLLDGPAPEIGFTPVSAIVPDMTLSSGGLYGLSFNGDPIMAADGVGKLAGGSLEAAFRMRDEVLVDVQDDLDAFAADLIARFEDPAADATRTATDPALLTDDGAVLDPANTIGLAQRLSVNTLVDPDAGGSLRYLRDGLGAAVAGPVGQATQLLASLGALTSLTPMTAGGPLRGVGGHAAAITSSIGAERLDAEDERTFAAARQTSLQAAEAAGGVDTDHEMQMLLRIEQSYAANAKLVQTVDRLINLLMEI